MRNSIEVDDPMVSIAYVKSALGRSRRSIYYWIDRGILPKPMKIAGRNAWFRSQIESVLNEFANTASE